MSKIFGELLMLIEADYREIKDNISLLMVSAFRSKTFTYHWYDEHG